MQLSTFSQLGGQTFASLTIRNYRLYFLGQGLSHIGNWMHTVALGWLVLTLTGSGTQLGGVLALRFLPMFMGPLFAGSIVDRYDKRTILYVTQSAFALLALATGLLVLTGTMAVWMLYALAFCFGLVDAIDNPTRQTFVHETVGPDNLRNAIGLNSTEANLARALGPLFAGTLIATIGIAFCFFANALSFLGLIVALSRMRGAQFHREHNPSRPTGHLLEGLRYAASVPTIRDILIAMAIIGTLSYEFQTSLPLLARGTFAGSAADYAALLSAMGAGSVIGGLFAAGRHSVSAREFILSAILFGVSISITALSPTLGYAVVGMVFVGFFSINLTSMGNTMVQLSSEASMRGRVMSLWSMALFGSTLVGAPIVGWMGEHVDPRAGLLLGGLSAIAAGAWAASRMVPLDTLLAVPAFIRMRSDEEQIGDTKI